ncbi:MAG: hypothetical protein JNM17_28150 [Archangium sp.]|nr:hypothetical protein [Archangium sp.]
MAAASPLQDAKRLVDDLEFAPALKLLDQLEKTEGNDTETLREIWLLQGISYGTLGKDAKTRDAFRKLLIVFPDTKLPADLPPRVKTPFFEAKDWASTQGALLATPKANVEGGKVTSVEVALGPDVLRLARVVRFKVKTEGAEKTEDVPLSGGKASLAIGAPSVEWTAELLSERKGILQRIEKRTDSVAASAPVAEAKRNDAPSLTPRNDAAPQTPAVVATTESNTWRRPTGLALLGAGALAAGIGVYFGVTSASTAARVTGAARDEGGRVTGVTQREAATLEAQAHSQATVANVLFGVGAGLGAAGAVLTILGPTREPVAQLSPAGAGLVITGQF